MSRHKESGQARLFREPVITTSLVTGETVPRMRRRKRLPGSETNWEMVQRANNWWRDLGRRNFHNALRSWTNFKGDLEREVGESTQYGSDAMDEASATESFTQALREAKKQRINPWEVVQRIKKYAELLRQQGAKESILLDEYFPQVVDLIDQVYVLTASRKETLSAFLAAQKTQRLP